MIRTMLRQLAAVGRLVLVGAAGVVAGCGALDVSDPTLIEETDLENSTGADLMRKGVLRTFAQAVSQAALTSGALADEFFVDINPDPDRASSQRYHEALDRRESQQYETLAPTSTTGYALWHAVRFAAMVALPRLQAYMLEPARAAYRGQMLAVRGFATLLLAEDFCPGFPLHTVVDGRLAYGSPHTTIDALEEALADFDLAVVLTADSTRFLHFARIGQARTLLGLGRFDEAAAAVALVPTDYVWQAEYSGSGSGANRLRLTRSSRAQRYSVADREGGNGLDFVTTDDPRVTTTLLGPAYDGVTEIRAIGKYPIAATPIVVASGIEARLIEAEAALRAGEPEWLTILNDLRRNHVAPALADTTDPGTEAARVDLLFRERAFWLFATGHRLGDLRRLVQHYGRDPETVFPTGAYRTGDSYGTATSVPFPAEEEAVYNPAVTGCTTR